MRCRAPILIAAVTTVLVLAACADDPAAPGDDPAATGDDPAATAGEEDAAAEPDAADPDEPAAADTGAESTGPAEVAVAATDLGDVVVDAEGMTLYLFLPDEQGPSTCTDACAQAWPPLVTDGEPVAGDGTDEALLGTTERDDGNVQVTYDGWPLYYWQGDREPGDVTGQNVEEVWFVVSPTGEPVMQAADTGDDRSGY
ncbi:hypothetical protein [Egicoccus sp. AB-alg2]|uniref:COG4315 family predicted lipoprotein n=1 Tax=Egicoccus sp. AB-alg2 TaxID=3242693 RepID=UPI00359E7607